MPLESTFADITARLRQGKFPNEQAISQGVVLRLLQELGWNTWDTALVWPEYQTGEGRADFALCHPPAKPAAFIEVKQPGRAEESVRQALEYAFHVGVPFVTLTDGRTWSFYLPAEQGSYDDRRVYKLDIFERPPADAAATLLRYLEHGRVESGDALETARQEYLELDIMKEIEIPLEELQKYRLEPNDLLITEGGDWDKVGRTAIWHGQIPNCIHQNHVFRARLVSHELLPGWFMLYFNSPTGRNYFESVAKQTTNLASINATELRACPVPIPPLAEQRRIVAKVDQLMALVDQLETQLTASRTTAEKLLEALVAELTGAKETLLCSPLCHEAQNPSPPGPGTLKAVDTQLCPAPLRDDPRGPEPTLMSTH